jgi:hypothetical protein
MRLTHSNRGFSGTDRPYGCFGSEKSISGWRANNDNSNLIDETMLDRAALDQKILDTIGNALKAHYDDLLSGAPSAENSRFAGSTREGRGAGITLGKTMGPLWTAGGCDAAFRAS